MATLHHRGIMARTRVLLLRLAHVQIPLARGTLAPPPRKAVPFLPRQFTAGLGSVLI